MSEALPRVLCVDDEPNILRALTRSLHGRFELVTAVGPHAGLEALEREGPFTVVLSDMRMPGMDGVEFLTKVSQRWPQTVRMLLTGMGDTDAADRATREGVIYRTLAKPCPVDDLRDALSVAVAFARMPGRPGVGSRESGMV
jgi:DNA-binding NtrC family response regulator